MQSLDAVTAVIPVVAALTRLGVRYYIGGSLAASIYGLARTTLDADLIADLKPEHAAPLTAALQPAYYANQDTIRDAIVRKSCFNVIFLANSFKIDVFVPKDRQYDRVAFQRIREDDIGSGRPSDRFWFPSPEDVVLAKLQWYRLGDETSDRQWRDIVEVMGTQGTVLDRQYLTKWSTELGVADLLAKAWKETETE
jgi:hypothetical protein